MKIYLILLFSLIGQYVIGQIDNGSILVTFDSSISYSSLKEMVVKEDGKVMVFAPGKAFLKFSDPVASNNLKGKGILLYEENGGVSPFYEQEFEKEDILDCIRISEQEDGYRVVKGVSDTLKGHTKCFLFFVNHASNPNSWNIAQQNQCINNVMINLLWWSEQAAAYGIDATFEVETYLFDQPECQVSVDPTVAADNIWKAEILRNLGYDRGNVQETQLDFLRDEIQSAGSDWGFIGYIIRGANTYRSNAGLFGPSTTCWVNATLNGYTFAHEVGHIFGLRDEYDEIAPLVYGFELNGLPNINADFRNYINAPCIMKSTIPIGICMFNPVHLHWTDQAEGITITTDPEDAIFEVQYLQQLTGQPFFQRRFQGRTTIPMGLGTRLRFLAPPNIETLSGAYDSPIWNTSGTDRVDIQLESGGATSAHVSYLPHGDALQPLAYLPQADYFTGRRIQMIRALEDNVITLTNHGLSVNNGSSSTVLDREVEIRPGSFSVAFRRALSFAVEEHNQFLIGSQAGIGIPEIALFKGTQEVQSWMPPNTFREQGGYIAATLTKEGHAIGAFEFGGIHVYNTNGTFSILPASSGLPSPNVRALYKDPEGDIWIGYDGGRQGEGVNGLYLLNTSNWSVVSNSKVPESIRGLSISSILPFESGQKLILIAGSQVYIQEGGMWRLLYQSSNQMITDATLFTDGRWALSSAQGVVIQDARGEWLSLHSETILLQENFVRSLCALPSGILLMGHNNAGITALYSDLSTSVHPDDPKSRWDDMVVFPNPSSHEIFLSTPSFSGESIIEIIALDGLNRHQWKTVLDGHAPSRLSIPPSLPNGAYILRLQNKSLTKTSIIHIFR